MLGFTGFLGSAVTSWRRLAGIAVCAAGAMLFAQAGALAQSGDSRVIRLKQNFAYPLQLGEDVAVVFVGNTKIAEAVPDKRRMLFLIGRYIGETNLLVFGKDGDKLLEATLIVGASDARHVTVDRGANLENRETLVCDPRCVGTKEPNSRSADTSLADLGEPTKDPTAEADAKAKAEEEKKAEEKPKGPSLSEPEPEEDAEKTEDKPADNNNNS